MNSGESQKKLTASIGRWQLILDYQVWICQKALAEKNYPIFNKSLFGKSWAGVQMPYMVFQNLRNGCLRHAMKNKLKNTFCRSWMEVDTNAMRSRNLNQVQSLMFQPLQKKWMVEYIVNGEKWYVTGANHADFFFIQAVIQDGDDVIGDALFFLDMDQEGGHVRTPLFLTHSIVIILFINSMMFSYPTRT